MPNLDSRISWWVTFYQGDVEVVSFFRSIMGSPLLSGAVYAMVAIGLCWVFMVNLRRGFNELSPSFARPSYVREYQGETVASGDGAEGEGGGSDVSGVAYSFLNVLDRGGGRSEGRADMGFRRKYMEDPDS